MDTPSSSGTEVARIRQAYLQRETTVPKDRYSFFREENLLAHLDLHREILRLLRRFRHTNLGADKILDVGCGRGYWLRQLVQWGARPENLFGIDLIPDRIQEGKSLCPAGVTFQCGDATELGFEDTSFDLVLQFTVFTSILDRGMKFRVAAEMNRVLKPGGVILWYDYFVSNPKNPDVRGVSRKEILDLFPGLSISLQRITLAPPIARAVGPISPVLHHLLSSCKPLRTHYLGLFQKQ
jgi:ubiquinone/menaquinone biosynthesis C-methylase UbiE